MTFSREPVVYLALVAIIVQIAIGYFTNNLDTTLVTSLVTALGAVFGRSQVTPVAKKVVVP